MSIYSRPYMRADDSRSFSSFDAVKWLLIVLGGAFVLQMLSQVWFRATYGPLLHFLALEPANFLGGLIYTILTYALLHGSFMHIVFNGLALYFSGKALQTRLGPVRTLELFLLSVLAGGLAWLGVTLVVHGGAGRLIGASAGVFGFLSLFALQNWRETIRFYFWFIPVSLTGQQIFYGLLGLQAFFFLFNEVAPGSMGGVAYSAHLGGFAVGYLYHRTLAERRTLWETLTSGRQGKRTKVSKPSSGGRFTVNLSTRKDRSKPPPNVRAEVDRILDKINKSGFGSLSEEEKRFLDKAKDALK